MPTSALEHPYFRLVQAILLVAAIVFGLTQLNLLDRGPAEVRVIRVTGEDPIAAAASAAREAYDGGADTVILVGSDAIADGVVASGLAGALKAPVLLNEPNRLSPQTRDIIRELDATRAILIGGTGALQGIVERTLTVDMELETTRIAGPSRFDTAEMVSREFPDGAGLVDGKRTALVVPAEDVTTGLAAGGVAAARAGALPVLYSQEGALPAPTLDALQRLGVEQLFATTPIESFDGEVVVIGDPTDTADTAAELRGFQPSRIVVVPDDDNARMLIGAPVAGLESGVIFPWAAAESWLIDNCGTIAELFVLAEDTVITEADVDDLIRAATICAD